MGAGLSQEFWDRGVRALRAHAGRGRAAGAAVWLLPVAVIGLIYFSPRHLVSANTVVTALLALGLVVIAARWPDRSLILLIVLLPFDGFLLAKLWALGMPTSVVRHLAAWKEALALGIVGAGLRNYLAVRPRADAVDRLALGFLAIAALYVIAQPAIVPSTPSSMSVRLLGFRQDAGFVLLLLAAKHTPFPPGFLKRAGRAVLAVAAVVAGICVFEALDSVAWNQFVVQTIKYTRYQMGVLHSFPQNYLDIRIYGTIGGATFIRSGSVFLNAVNCGFYLVLGFAVGMERVRRGQARPWVMVSLIVIGAGILLTQTRSAILGCLVVTFLVLQPAAGRHWHRRAQLGILIAALAVIAIPSAVATGLAQRVVTTTSAHTQSTQGHVAGFWDGLKVVGHHPLGQGLGTSAGVGQRFDASHAVIPENNYLQYGAELGVVPMLVFIALTVALVLGLRRAARRRPDAMVAAAWTALAGLAIGALFLQTWNDFSVSWTVWGVAGAVLGIAGRGVRPERPGRPTGTGARLHRGVRRAAPAARPRRVGAGAGR